LVEYESRWAEPARANLTHAAYGAPSGGRVLQGDAGRLISLLDWAWWGGWRWC
jgi:hypothetical protein